MCRDVSASTGLAGGVTPEQAAAVLSELARLHASEWSESTTPRSAGDFARLRPFVEQHAAASTRYLTEQIDERASARTRRYAEEVAGYFASLSAGPQTRTHGDAHPGNVLIPRSPGARPVLIDWQGSAINAPLRDVSRFLTLGLSIEDRQAHEEDLLHGYLDQLATRNVHYDPATALRDYRTALLLQWGWAVLFFRHEPIWDRDTRAAMPALVRRAAAAFDDALAGLDLGVTNS